MMASTSAPITLREALPSDAGRIARLHASSWRTAYRGALSDDYLAHAADADRQALWEARFKAPAANQHVLVAHSGDELLGFACFYANADDLWGGLLDNIHVRADAQGRDIGSLMLHAIARHALARSPEAPMHLWVLQANTKAQSFYRRHGGEPVGDDIWIPPGGGQVPRHRFAWTAQRLVAHFPANWPPDARVSLP